MPCNGLMSADGPNASVRASKGGFLHRRHPRSGLAPVRRLSREAESSFLFRLLPEPLNSAGSAYPGLAYPRFPVGFPAIHTAPAASGADTRYPEASPALWLISAADTSRPQAAEALAF